MTHPTPSPRILLLAAGHPDREELARVLSDAGTVIRGASSEPPDLVVAAGPAEGAADEERAGASRGRELSPIPVLQVVAEGDGQAADADDVLVWPVERDRLALRARALLSIRSRAGAISDEMRRLNAVSLSLATEYNPDVLLRRLLREARALTGADAGTVYLVDRDARLLRFHSLQNDTLGLDGGVGDTRHRLPPVPMDWNSVSGYAALSGEAVNLPDVYAAEGFEFRGPREYDALTGYRCRSMLVVPIMDHRREVAAVLQLINAREGGVGEPGPFGERIVDQVRGLAAQAGVALSNARLIRDLQSFLEGLLELMAAAIDTKSPYTAGHIERVTGLALLLAEAVNDCPDDRFGGRRFSLEELNEIRVAGLLHDVGKLVIPEHLADKATKLQGVSDRMAEIRTRFSVIRRGLELLALRRKLELGAGCAPRASWDAVDAELMREMDVLDDDLAFLETINRGGEFMTPDRLERLHAIAARTYTDDEGDEQPYLTPHEARSLAIQRGTLLPEELEVIRTHASVSGRLLSRIPFSRDLRRVPEIAGDHHEALDGSGYPRGKRADQISLQARILTIADIFDALTAVDRPYKRAYPPELAFQILRDEAERGRLDASLVELFIQANCPARLRDEGTEPPAGLPERRAERGRGTVAAA